MSLLLDTRYIAQIGSRLEMFSQVRHNLWNCRCPICGDSQKKKTKRRFFFYQNTKDGFADFMSCVCHNCGYSSSFYKFLEQFDSSTFGQYRLELFKERGSSSYERVEPKKEEPKAQPVRVEPQIDLFRPVSTLPGDHPCVQYLRSRRVPEQFFEILGYTDNFRNDFGTFSPLIEDFHVPADPRLVIPFVDQYRRIEVLQGRALEPSSIRYITLKSREEAKKVYGMDRVNLSRTVLVVEGPIDSLFLPNCIATADGNLISAGVGDLFIFDNQYRNKEVCGNIEKAISAGKKVVLFPPWFEHKDINDAVKDGGLSPRDLIQLIGSRVFQGLRARLEFDKLRKV